MNAIYTRISNEHKPRLRGNYLWGVLQTAYLATQIGISRISVIEFGVAGGLGLTSLDEIASVLEEEFGIGIDVYGFDTGVGLPPPTDYPDMPNIYSGGDYIMDFEKLKSKLKKQNLL